MRRCFSRGGADAVHEETVSIPSAGLRLHGVVGVPADVAPGERRAAFLEKVKRTFEAW